MFPAFPLLMLNNLYAFRGVFQFFFCGLQCVGHFVFLRYVWIPTNQLSQPSPSLSHPSPSLSHPFPSLNQPSPTHLFGELVGLRNSGSCLASYQLNPPVSLSLGELEAESQPGAHRGCNGHLSRARRECAGLLSAVGDHAHWPTCRPQSWQLQVSYLL
jgi:hypothetical protein